MALPNSGALSLSSIQGEFGGSNPISLSEYYRGGPLVGSISNTSNIPSSGTISVSNFYGTSSSIPADLQARCNLNYNTTGGKFPTTTIQTANWIDSSMNHNNISASFLRIKTQQAGISNQSTIQYNAAVPVAFFSGLSTITQSQPNAQVLDFTNGNTNTGYTTSVSALPPNFPAGAASYSQHSGPQVGSLYGITNGNPCIINYS